MLIPSQVVLTYVRPSYWLSGLEITWGILTGLIATTTNARQIYAIRVLLGLCESSAWPGMMTILMHWYTPLELAKRMGFYHSCQAIGGMMSGAMQAAISSTLEGHGGIAGWRWLFIINSIMTIILGCAGFFMLPDYPNRPNPRAIWFTKEHAETAMQRLARHGKAEPKSVSWTGAKYVKHRRCFLPMTDNRFAEGHTLHYSHTSWLFCTVAQSLGITGTTTSDSS